MKKGVRSIGTLTKVVSFATIGSFFVGLISLFLTNFGHNLAQEVTGPPQMTSSGDVRPEFIASQINVVYWALGILAVLGGLALAWLVYNLLETRAQNSIGLGAENKLLPGIAFISVPLALIFFSISIPDQVFQLTNSSFELQRQAGLLAWAARHWLGGLVLGVSVYGVALLVAVLIAVVFQTARTLKERQIRRHLTRAQA